MKRVLELPNRYSFLLVTFLVFCQKYSSIVVSSLFSILAIDTSTSVDPINNRCSLNNHYSHGYGLNLRLIPTTHFIGRNNSTFEAI
jgi:hypothetical protein